MCDDNCRLALVAECCREVKDLEGDAVEIGVYKGDSAAVICDELDCTVHLFDTFCGMPKAMIGSIDTHRAGDFGDTSLTAVEKRFKPLGSRVQFHQGVFSGAGLKPRIKFAHVDVDLFKSTKDALEWCWPLLVDGGVILNDDYLCMSCPGAKCAVDEFVARHGCSCEVKWKRAILRRHR